MPLQSSIHTTAILVFGRTAFDENRVKRFDQVDVSNHHKIGVNLLSHTLCVAQQSGLDYFLIDSNNQVGNQFYEKLYNAIQSVFDKGYHNVITIGTDCPELNSAHLRSAQQLLQIQEAVFGPDSHGGVYLLAYNQEAFKKSSFAACNWGSPALLTDLEAQMDIAPTSRLPLLEDINNAAELKQFVRNHKFHWLSVIFQKSFETIAQVINRFIISIHLFGKQLVFRGPPISLGQ